MDIVATPTQTTSINTDVSSDFSKTLVTTVAPTILPGAFEEFDVIATDVTTSTLVLACLQSYGSANGNPMITITDVQAGQFTIRITNVDGATNIDAAMVIGYLFL
jgi:fructose-1,6-bisphosphatase